MAPMGCQPIPSHVTSLYIFAVINLILLLNITFTEANILILDQDNRTISKVENELAARFGPEIPSNGVWGHLAYTKPNNGCSKIEPPPLTSTEWVALIKRGDCDFDIKVLNAQNAGYLAAIVFNNESNNLVPMGGGSSSKFVTIPSVFIGKDDADYLYNNFDRSTTYAILLTPIPYVFRLRFLFNLALVSCILIISVMFFAKIIVRGSVRFFRDCNKRRRSRLSKSNLKKIPTKKFKKGDDYDICAICIDEYEEGDKLRILPCSHAYHQKCIDPWLTKNKKTCPICKRKVIPGRDGESGSESSSQNSSDDEQQPLLPAQDLRRGQLVLGGASMGGTFDNAGLPENLRSHVMRLPDSSSDDSDDSGDESENRTPSSLHQSSVEVHQPTTAILVDETVDTDAASEVGIFGNGRETEEDEVTALIGAEGGVGVNAPMTMAEDHFNPAEEKEQEEEAKEEVQVVPGKRNRRKKKRGGGGGAGGSGRDENV